MQNPAQPPPPRPPAGYGPFLSPPWPPPPLRTPSPWTGVVAILATLVLVAGGIYAAVSVSRPTVAALPVNVNGSIVDVTTELLGGEALGTGMVVSPNGYVLTNNHVIQGADRVMVQVGGQGKTYAAVVRGTDPNDDVALLQIQNSPPLRTIPLGDSKSLSIGDSVTALGNALGRGGPPKQVTGKVSALNQSITAVDAQGQNAETLDQMIEFDAPIQPGDSGGPLFDHQGRVVGMTTAGSERLHYRAAANVGFAIPINAAADIAQKIEHGQFGGNILGAHTAFIGVGVSPSYSQSGLNIDTVEPGTPAAHAGLAPGDTLVWVANRYVGSVDDLRHILLQHKPGQTIDIFWYDAYGLSHNTTISLASGPAP